LTKADSISLRLLDGLDELKEGGAALCIGWNDFYYLG
jgi:hypothetical protein